MDDPVAANLIVRPTVQKEQRLAVLGSRLMIVAGRLQNEEGVIHILADRIRDYSRWLGDLTVASRDFR